MAAKRGVRVAAREAMQKFAYDPLETLVMFAQDAATNNDTKMKIAETLLPYMYPKLSNMTLDAEVGITQGAESRAGLLRKLLDDPELADAAARLSIAASMAALGEDSGDTGFLQ